MHPFRRPDLDHMLPCLGKPVDAGNNLIIDDIHASELADMRHPQCLEPLDSEQRLRDFVHAHAEELRKVHAVLFLCELPLAHNRNTHHHEE